MTGGPLSARWTTVGFAVLLATAVAVALAACGSANQLPAQTRASSRIKFVGGRPRVAVVVMENEEYGDIIGSRQTPFINRLARQGALPRQMYAITHPSQPNYLSLVSGSNGGITDDCSDCSAAGSGLPGQLSAAGRSWRAYMEDLPHPCFDGGEAGGYARKHDPFIVLTGLRQTASQCRRIVPLSTLATDERRHRLPDFTWITPNLCHDMHDCDPSTGDRFLAGLIPPLLRSLGPRGLLILTWDEGSSDNGCCRLAHGGHIATVLAGPLARSGARLQTPVDHFSVLQAVEDLFGLPRTGGAACGCTPSLGALLRRHG